MVREIFSRDELLRDLQENIFCRLMPSSIHGIGVFAVRKISANTNPFVGLRTTKDEWFKIPKEEIFDDPLIPDTTKQMVRDFYIVRDGLVFLPQHSLNEIWIAYYLNCSETPNMREENGEFYTLREILPGEELTVNYATYSDE